MGDGLLEIGRDEATQSINGQGRVLDQGSETGPTEWAGSGMCGGRADRGQQCVVEAQGMRPLELRGIVTGGADQLPGRTRACLASAQGRGGEMQAMAWQ